VEEKESKAYEISSRKLVDIIYICHAQAVEKESHHLIY
jgi:hypothetical protein